MIKNNKGFTLLEIIITLAISIIVITMIGSFLITNIKHYNRIDDSTEIMDQAQFISGFLDIELSQSAGIKKIISKDGISILDSNSGSYIKEIELYTWDESQLINPSFQIKNGKDIFYKSHSELGTFIEDFYVSPLPANTSFKDCSGIEYEIYFKKNNSSYVIEKSINFRNKY
jgi:Tfp pilus assembly protein PilE